MSGSQPGKTTDPTKSGKPLEITARIEQNVRPLVSEVQRRAAKTSVSGRHAVFRGRLFLLFYLWMLVGAVFLSLLARRTSFLPGDRAITSRLQKQRNPWLRRLFYAVSEIGFPNISTPITLAVAGIFYALRFRLEAFFILLTSSSVLLNVLVKRLIKRPRPAKELVTVVRVINEPSFPSGHVMYFTNFYGLLIYLLATNWRSGKLRNLLITLCILLIVAV
ncbi:MAG: phosphatase PAP2 family protein, partial [Ktedonobacteraceae bacterium]|nr:phosphatase PAP2 family protein [Ktedonobacteraceae bacterium]